MSFGFSPSDIVALITLTTKAYRGWKSACAEYADITKSLDSFLLILERIEDEAGKPNSALVRKASDKDDLADILHSSSDTIRDLDHIILRYRSLGLGKSREKNWDKIRFGVKDLDSLRSKLGSHLIRLTTYLEVVGLASLTRIERELNILPDIKKTIDGLAADIRAGRREGLEAVSPRKIGEGMRSSIIHKYKPQIRQYLATLAEQGLLEETEHKEEADLAMPDSKCEGDMRPTNVEAGLSSTAEGCGDVSASITQSGTASKTFLTFASSRTMVDKQADKALQPQSSPRLSCLKQLDPRVIDDDDDSGLQMEQQLPVDISKATKSSAKVTKSVNWDDILVSIPDKTRSNSNDGSTTEDSMLVVPPDIGPSEASESAADTGNLERAPAPRPLQIVETPPSVSMTGRTLPPFVHAYIERELQDDYLQFTVVPTSDLQTTQQARPKVAADGERVITRTESGSRGSQDSQGSRRWSVEAVRAGVEGASEPQLQTVYQYRRAQESVDGQLSSDMEHDNLQAGGPTIDDWLASYGSNEGSAPLENPKTIIRHTNMPGQTTQKKESRNGAT